VASLCCDTVINFDLYLQSHEHRVPVLYRQRDLPFTAQVRERLADHAVEQLYVRKNQSAEYSSYLEKNLGTILEDRSITSQERSSILYTAAANLAEELMHQTHSEEVFDRSRHVVHHSVQFFLKRNTNLETLLQATSTDYVTYTHSVNVLLYSIALGRHMGLSDEDVIALGNAALLHDVGKSMVDPAILNYPGNLSADQREAIKRHPSYGCEILRKYNVADQVILDVVIHHHEKMDGSGYPDGLKGDQISLFARILAVVDAFDALTTRRPHREAMSTFQALSTMNAEMRTALDPSIFRSLIGMLSVSKSS